MAYYILNPEVPGGMGQDTIIKPPSAGSYLPHVDVLHLVISGWMGDDLLTSFPCFMVTNRLKHALEVSNLSGFKIAEMDVTIDPQLLMFPQMAASWPLPELHRLKIVGRAGTEDFGLTPLDAPVSLVVSSLALELLQKFQIKECEIVEYPQ